MADPSHFQHPQSIVESSEIGPGTRIWAFAHVLPGARIGADCNICDHTFIENDVRVGDRVTIKCGVQLWDGCRIEDDVFIGPNATFTNDPAPRSRQHLAEYPETLVRHGATIGANATILPGVTIGQKSMIGAGAVVTRPVPPFAVVVGSPARIIRYVDDAGEAPVTAESVHVDQVAGLDELRVAGVTLHHAPTIKDLRGDLSTRELGAGLPFRPRRYFMVSGVRSREVRGEHAHRECKQLLVCLSGSVSCVVDDGEHRQEVVLDSPDLALYLPPMVWGVQYKYSHDAVLLVLASDRYDPDDYIRDYDDFIVERRRLLRDG